VIEKTYIFRPVLRRSEYLNECYRYANGRWIEDDGEFDLAFIGINKLGVSFAFYVELPYYRNLLWTFRECKEEEHDIEWHYMIKGEKLEDWWEYDHPNVKAKYEASDEGLRRWGCANGRMVEFMIGDPHIALEVLRTIDGEVAQFPSHFYCNKCKRWITEKVKAHLERILPIIKKEYYIWMPNSVRV